MNVHAAMQMRTAVDTYCSSKQLPLFVLYGHSTAVLRVGHVYSPLPARAHCQRTRGMSCLLSGRRGSLQGRKALSAR